MAKQTENLDELRVVDLRDKAKEAGVSGASHMRKEELIDALHGQQQPAGAAAAPAGDVLAILKADHEKVKALFQQALAKESGDERIEELAQRIIMELKLHTEAEEQIFYPALKTKAVEADEDDAKDGVLEAYVEHGSVKELIERLESLSSSDESYKAILQVMSEQVEHHVEEEEGEMFKKASALLAKEELSDIGLQVAAFKKSAKVSAL